MKEAKILSATLLGLCAAWACDASDPVTPGSDGVNGTNGTNGATGGPNAASTTAGTSTGGGASTTLGASTNAGTTGSDANTTTSGTTGGGPVECTNTDLTTLPLDETGWVARECNSSGIQGAWYCYADNIAPTSCVSGMVPYRAGAGMCVSGETVMDDTFAAWGAGIGLSLNETGEGEDGSASVKSAYNATMNEVAGFRISITGDTGGKPIRVGFTGAAADTGLPSPFWELPAPPIEET